MDEHPRDEHRKSRLRHLIKADYGTQIAFHKATGISEARISQAVKPQYPFAEDAATIWEGKLELPPGWFNKTWPTPKEAKKLGIEMTDGYPGEKPSSGVMKIADLSQPEIALVLLFRTLSHDHQHELLILANKLHNEENPGPSEANPFANAPAPGSPKPVKEEK